MAEWRNIPVAAWITTRLYAADSRATNVASPQGSRLLPGSEPEVKFVVCYFVVYFTIGSNVAICNKYINIANKFWAQRERQRSTDQNMLYVQSRANSQPVCSLLRMCWPIRNRRTRRRSGCCHGNEKQRREVWWRLVSFQSSISIFYGYLRHLPTPADARRRPPALPASCSFEVWTFLPCMSRTSCCLWVLFEILPFCSAYYVLVIMVWIVFGPPAQGCSARHGRKPK